MSIRILLLRGINVGGRNRLPMADLRHIALAAGATAVRSYLQSGNLIVSGDVEMDTISRAILKVHGFQPLILERNLSDWRQIVHDNPFPQMHDHRALHLYVLASPGAVRNADLERFAGPGEDVLVTPSHVYLKSPSLLSGSQIARRIERAAGVGMTARNWRTVTALLDLAERFQAS